MTRRLRAAGLVLVLALPALAAEWRPAAWVSEDTIELLTVGPDGGEHWFPVWLVVLDGDVFVRLGSRAAARIEANRTRPYVGVRIAGAEFPRVRGEPAPETAARVAAAMGEKYWSDVVIRHLAHPLTLRLRPDGP
jgi:hypothetical protein